MSPQSTNQNATGSLTIAPQTSEAQQLFQQHLVHLIIVVAGILVGIIITIVDSRKRRQKQAKNIETEY